MELLIVDRLLPLIRWQLKKKKCNDVIRDVDGNFVKNYRNITKFEITAGI